MRWVEVVEEVDVAAALDVAVAPVAAAAAGRAGWAVEPPPGRAEIASAPTVGTGNRTRSDSRVIRKSVLSAARR